MRLQAKALECLRVAALTIGSPERLQALDEVSSRWSWRALAVKFDELVERGYIEPLKGGTACGGVTEKGRHALITSGVGNETRSDG